MNLETIKGSLKSILEDKNKVRYLIAGIAGLFLIILLSIVLLSFFKKEDYAVLYSNLKPDDAGNVLTVLSQESIPYKVEGNGTIIMVPKDKVHETRLKLAAKGLPSGKVVGFELFEEPKLGTTQFQENVNYIRAVEGELVRTIKHIDAVADAKVNIALPKDSIFVKEEEEAKASVIIKLYPDKDLTREQVKAIVFLVSRAVNNLKPENVTVVDNRGRVLSDILDDEQGISTGDKAVDVKRKIEKQIEKDIQSMLAKVVGPERVVVKATVELEVGKINQKDEIYDPDRVAVVSERKIKESETESPQTLNAPPGTPTNVPPVMNFPLFSGGTKQKEKSDITTNYDVSKSLIETQKPLFVIKKVSVGVMIDGKYREVKDKDGNITRQFEPRTQQELQSYENLIKSAIGFNPERGDQVTVISVPFEAVKDLAEEQQKLDITKLIILAVLLLILIGLVVFLILKTVKKKKEEKAVSLPTTPELATAQAAKAYEEEKSIIDSFENIPEYLNILKVAEESPELIASIISKWLKEEVKKK